MKEPKSSFGQKTSMLAFIKQSSGTRASPPVKSDTGYEEPDDLPQITRNSLLLPKLTFVRFRIFLLFLGGGGQNTLPGTKLPSFKIPYMAKWAGRSGIESRCGRDFPPVQTSPGAHPASCKMGTDSFPGVKCGRGVLPTTHPLLVPRSWKSRPIPLPTLWATPGL